MHPALLKTYTTITAWRMTEIDRLRSGRREGILGDRGEGILGDRGEGIVSVAIAVLIMAALGVVAYAGFNAIFDSARDQAQTEIDSIGG